MPERELDVAHPATSITVVTDAPAATESLGRAIGAVIVPGDVVLLVGELGSGKTTLTKGLAAALGAREAVTSPTFAICHLYDSEPPLAHVDCWRLGGVEELDDLALEELLDDGGVAVLEWGGLADERFGADALYVDLALPAVGGRAVSDELRRHCVLRASGARWSSRIDALCAELIDVGLLGSSAGSRPDRGDR